MRRTRYHIRFDILNLCKESMKKTQIVYQCNLNFKIIQKYLSFLIERGYIAITKAKTRNLYRTTPKGNEYMDMLSPVVN